METNIKGALILEGHVQGLSNTRALGEAGIPVYVLDVNTCLARFSKYCRKFFICPNFRSPEFISFLAELAEKENLQGWMLVPSNDHIVENISHHLDRLKKYYKTTVPAPEKLRSIIDKGMLVETAQSCGVPVPQTFLPKNLSDTITGMRFPVLIKGRAGLSFYKNVHAKALQAGSPDEFVSLLQKASSRLDLQEIMVQELIPYSSSHKVISFTAFCIDGEIMAHWSGEKLREHPVKYGTGTFAKSIVNHESTQYSRILLQKLGYTGVCEVEFLFDPRDGQYKLIEINPRTWLWVGLAKACGINYALMMYNYLNGLATDYPKEYTTNMGWINYFTDTVFSFIALLKGQLTIKEYLRPMRIRKVKAVFSWRDFLPGFLFPFMAFYIARKRG